MPTRAAAWPFQTTLPTEAVLTTCAPGATRSGLATPCGAGPCEDQSATLSSRCLLVPFSSRPPTVSSSGSLPGLAMLPLPSRTVVAGGYDDRDPLPPQGLQGHGERVDLVRQRAAGGQRQVDDVDLGVGRDCLQSLEDRHEVGAAVVAGDPHVEHVRAGGDAGVGAAGGGAVTGDQAGHEGAVAVAVAGPVAGDVDVGEAAGQVGDIGDAGVDDGDRHAGAFAVRGPEAEGGANRAGRPAVLSERPETPTGRFGTTVHDEPSATSFGSRALTPPMSGSWSRTSPPAAVTACTTSPTPVTMTVWSGRGPAAWAPGRPVSTVAPARASAMRVLARGRLTACVRVVSIGASRRQSGVSTGVVGTVDPPSHHTFG